MRSTLLLVFWALSVNAFAGGHIVGNSADSYRIDHGVAWWRGPAPVQACVRISRNFGISASEAISVIHDVFGNWEKYRERKGVKLSFPQVYVSPTCRGDEALVFLLGVETLAVHEARKKYEDASALAERTEFNLTTGRGKGFVWVANPTPKRDWRLPGRFFGILSHEIGHVLGCEHVADTVMDANVLNWLFHAEPPHPDAEFRRIDRAFELVHCSNCTFVAEGGIPSISPLDELETFRAFAGREPVGDIRARLESQTSLLSDNEEQLRMKLLWTDDVGSVEIPIRVPRPWNSLRLLDARVFNHLVLEPDFAPRVNWRIPFVGFTDGVVREKNGTEHTLVLEYNLSYTGPLALSYVPKIGARRRFLFAGSVKWQ